MLSSTHRLYLYKTGKKKAQRHLFLIVENGIMEKII